MAAVTRKALFVLAGAVAVNAARWATVVYREAGPPRSRLCIYNLAARGARDEEEPNARHTSRAKGPCTFQVVVPAEMSERAGQRRLWERVQSVTTGDAYEEWMELTFMKTNEGAVGLRPCFY